MDDFKRDPVLENVEVVIFRDGEKIVVRDVLAYSLGDGDIEILECELARISELATGMGVTSTSY